MYLCTALLKWNAHYNMIKATEIHRDPTDPEVWLMTCPRCKRILAAATDLKMMPEYTLCNCDYHDLLSR